jgi:succinate dehydrogenase/fumarate reductase cytochrome b subunit
MQGSDRIVFGRAFSVTPVWLWLIQRLSGLLLGPVVAVHMWMPDASMSRSLNALLLLLVVGHGYSGIRRLAQTEKKSHMITAHAWAWLILVAVFGLLIVVSGK